jgi:hypothetical protein
MNKYVLAEDGEYVKNIAYKGYESTVITTPHLKVAKKFSSRLRASQCKRQYAIDNFDIVRYDRISNSKQD